MLQYVGWLSKRAYLFIFYSDGSFFGLHSGDFWHKIKLRLSASACFKVLGEKGNFVEKAIIGIYRNLTKRPAVTKPSHSAIQ